MTTFRSEESFSRGRELLTFMVNGLALFRVKFGEADDLYPKDLAEERGYCGDCGARKGEVHIPDCEWEACPHCKKQLLSCDCHLAPHPDWPDFGLARQRAYECIHGDAAVRPEPRKNLVN